MLRIICFIVSRAMKSIGLIGGMSWESTVLYYQTINREVARRLGGLHSGRIQLCSLDFAQVAAGQQANDWDGLARQLGEAAQGLTRAGADCVLIATNTMHKVAPQVQAAIEVPLLHIADATAAAIGRAGCRRVALLGTRYTMEQPFYREHLARAGIETLVPEAADRNAVHQIIFDELCRGQVLDRSRQTLQAIVERLTRQGAEGVVLGCTELPLLLGPADVPLPVFDTTTLHALAAVDFALAP